MENKNGDEKLDLTLRNYLTLSIVHIVYGSGFIYSSLGINITIEIAGTADNKINTYTITRFTKEKRENQGPAIIYIFIRITFYFVLVCCFSLQRFSSNAAECIVCIKS